MTLTKLLSNKVVYLPSMKLSNDCNTLSASFLLTLLYHIIKKRLRLNNFEYNYNLKTTI